MQLHRLAGQHLQLGAEPAGLRTAMAARHARPGGVDINLDVSNSWPPLRSGEASQVRLLARGDQLTARLDGESGGADGPARAARCRELRFGLVLTPEVGGDPAAVRLNRTEVAGVAHPCDGVTAPVGSSWPRSTATSSSSPRAAATTDPTTRAGIRK